jgi:DNA mismatch repair ATPase MutS
MIRNYIFLLTWFFSSLVAYNRYADIPDFHNDHLNKALNQLTTLANNYDYAPHTTVMDKEVWRNTDIFTVAQRLNRTITAAGRVTFTRILLDPTTNPDTIKQRQAFITFLIQNPGVYAAIKIHLSAIAKEESHLLSLLESNELFNQDEVRNAYTMISRLKGAPAISTALNIGYLVKILQIGVPCALACASALLVLFNLARPSGNKLISQSKMGIAIIASGLLGILSGINMQFLYKESLIPRYTLRKLCAISCFMKNVHELGELSSFMHTEELCTTYQQYAKNAALSLEPLRELLSDSTFNSAEKRDEISFKRFFFCDKGMIANGLLATNNLIPTILTAYPFIGLLDTYFSIATLIKEHSNTKTPFCFVDIITNSATPYLKATGFYHPLLEAHRTVVNSLTLGSEKNPRNIFISGVNAGGKSTIMKALALCCILAQTFGIAPAQLCSLTPFAKINTYLNIVDDVRNETSLFKAELIRAHTLLYNIENTLSTNFCFTVLDEICRGTEHTEGEALAYAIAKKIASFPHSLSLFSSHFEGLQKLAITFPTLYKNMHVGATITNNNTFLYSYLLKEGPSNQQIAPDLLERIGLPAVMTTKMRDVLNNPHLYTAPKQERTQ